MYSVLVLDRYFTKLFLIKKFVYIDMIYVVPVNNYFCLYCDILFLILILFLIVINVVLDFNLPSHL